jgi:hypothetical protein
MIPTDLYDKYQQALNAGIPEWKIQQKITSLYGSDALSQIKPQSPGLLQSIVSGITKPATTALRTIAAGGYEAGRLLPAITSQYLPGLAKTQISSPYLRGETKNPFMGEEEMQQIQQHPISEAFKRSAGVASYAIPGGGGTSPNLLMRLLSSAIKGGTAAGLYGASEAEGNRPEEILAAGMKSAPYGAATGLAFQGLGEGIKGLRALKSKATTGISKQSAKTYLNASPTAYEKAMEAGIDINTLPKKYGIQGSYDDALAQIKSRIDDTEGIIKQQTQAAGRTMKINVVDDLIAQLKKEKLTAKKGLDAAKANAIDEMIKNVKAQYGSGVTYKQALDLKRIADAKFGRAVIEDTKGSVTTSTQKMIANTLRSKLKKAVPEIADALDSEHDLIVLREILNKAKAKGEVGQLAYKGLTNTLLGMTVNKPEVASKLAQMGVSQGVGRETNQGLLQQILSRAPQMVGAVAGTVPTQPSQGISTTYTPSYQSETTQPATETMAKTGLAALTPEQVLMLSVSFPEYASIIQTMYKTATAGTKKTAAETQKEQQKQGMTALLNDLEGNYNYLVNQGLTASGPGLGLLSGVSGTLAATLQTNPQAKAYNDTRQAFMALILRSLGEKGTLTDKDIERIDRALPTFYDTPETARLKFNAIKKGISSGAYTGGNTIIESNTSLQDILNQTESNY